ncbi:MAG: ABC transporter ATP-binding protein [Candidatus Omnitrophota bacterium]|nr:ABC transporter ATP-binding protein [Candidatus Omnitrophota bacterium]MBU1928607.1 ABC transporter ATP-binding protein [Candidatus Omnitrophota bacterium]MBU2034620.1 ABC transporter ATP-binding protein [Candidatus Omnitrophota bacterium]MBU2221874.1 ABC transporter ATP-binding protein [Candidatus Omnitrophota bacterium]MBU2258436.1 ABC transporter ATP-binding protein [Candidatus Omnitrophota bacterium]
MAIIELKNLNKSFNDHQVLNNLNLIIEKGSTLVVIGRSGCGKSVLLKHIIGILNPDSGSVLVNGQDIWQTSRADFNKIIFKMNMVFQGGALFDSLSVGENVGFELIEHNLAEGVGLDKKIKEALSLVDLFGISHLMPSELSGGMRKRVALARAICMHPEIILYDEPTTGVDPITADSINELIKSLQDKLKVTSIVVTHDMKSAYKIGDRIAMLYKGKIIVEGSPEEIQNSRDPFVHQFINGLAKGPITED